LIKDNHEILVLISCHLFMVIISLLAE